MLVNRIIAYCVPLNVKPAKLYINANQVTAFCRSTYSRAAMVAFCAAVVFVIEPRPVFAQNDDLEQLYAQIEAIKADSEERRSLLVDQKALLKLAKKDPEAARKALKPYPECLKTIIRPYCPLFRENFKPE